MSYFDSNENKARLFESVEKWRGTPFHAKASVCGVGVDCVHLVAAIYIECGFLKSFNPPDYTMDGGAHDQSSKVIKWVEGTYRFGRIWFEGATGGVFEYFHLIEPGDLICFKLGRVPFHTGIALSSERFFQVYQGQKASDFPLADSTWLKRISAIYRPLEDNRSLYP